MRTPKDAVRSLKRYLAAGLGSEWEVRLDRDPGAVHWPFCRLITTGPLTFAGGADWPEFGEPFVFHAHPGPKETPEEAVFAAEDVRERLFVMFRRGAGLLNAPTGLVATAGSGGTLGAGTYRYLVTAICRGETPPSAAASATVGATGKVTLTWTDMPGAHAYHVWRGAAGAEDLLGWATAGSFIDDGKYTLNTTAPLPVANTTQVGAPMRVPLYDYDGVAASAPATDAANRPYPSDFMRVTAFEAQLLPDPEDDRRVAVTANIRVSWVRRGRLFSEARTVTSVRSEPK